MQNQKPKAMVKIHGLSFSDGQGVGRSEDGKVYFVDYACPEDLVEIETYKDNKKFGFAKISEIHESSPHRTTPLCSVFTKCGGCSLQHVSYTTQLIEKQKVLKRYHNKNPDFKLEPFEACEQSYNYRTRVEIHVQNNRWGFYQKKSKNLVFPEKCHLVTSKVQNHLDHLDQSDGHYHVDASGIKPRSRGLDGVFEQINTNIDQKIKSYLTELIQQNVSPTSQKIIYDLYAGHGNYSLTLAPQFSRISFVTVELSQFLIQKGRSLITNNAKINWICSDVLSFLKQSKANAFDHNLIMVNPPRDGMEPQALNELLKLKPKLLIYISCNPMTLFRDIDALSPKYSLKSLKGFDMFPQTMHFETVALLNPT